MKNNLNVNPPGMGLQNIYRTENNRVAQDRTKAAV